MQLLAARAAALRPRPRRTVSEWCLDNVSLVQGLTPKLDVGISPHMRGPLNRVSDRSVKEMHWLWSPGGGKTTGIEGLIQYRMTHQPSNILLVGQKDDTAERWMETRLLPSMKKNPELKSLLPSQQGKDRHKMRKATVIFNHGFYLEAGGSAESNLQEKSMPMVIFEEAWKISEHPGRIQQGKQRTHDKWDSLILYVGQAGVTHLDPDMDDSVTDLYREWKKTNQMQFNWCCPKCGSLQPFKWDQMKWDKEELDDGAVDWAKTDKTVRLQCPECETDFHDTVSNRRMIAESAIDHPETDDGYVPTNKNALTGCVGYQANAMCYWRIPWAKLVKQFHEAMDAKYRGDLSLLQVFIMQRLCEFWTPLAYEDEDDLSIGDYSVDDYENGELIDGEEIRGIGVDVQQSSLWFTIGAIDGDSNLKVLFCGQAVSFEEIDQLRAKYKVQRKCVLVDCQYRTDYVFQKCAEFGWTAYQGDGRKYFQVVIQGKPTKVPYSRAQPVQSGSGKKTRMIALCVNPIKDVIAEMRAGRSGEMMTPGDIDPRFRDHLNAERKVRRVFGKEKREQEFWERKGKRDNHMLDNVVALVGLGMIRRLIRVPETDQPPPNASGED